jgi:GTP-binding protein EngB required for normal cell division
VSARYHTISIVISPPITQGDKFLQALVLLNQYKKEYDLDIDDLPFFYTMGSQNAGKTLLIEFLTQMPLGFSDDTIATRCPVKYLLKCDPDLSQPEVKFQGREIQAEELRTKVREHMSAIKGVSAEIADVTIVAPHVRDMVFVDLPGFNNLETERAIRDLVVSYMKKPNAFGVFVVTPTDKDMTANSGISPFFAMAREAGVPKAHEKLLVVVNKVDTMSEWLRPKQTEHVDKFMFPALHEINDNFMFICLNSTAEKIKNHSFAEREEFLRSVIRKENEFFAEKLYPNLQGKCVLATPFSLHLYISTLDPSLCCLHVR